MLFVASGTLLAVVLLATNGCGAPPGGGGGGGGSAAGDAAGADPDAPDGGSEAGTTPDGGTPDASVVDGVETGLPPGFGSGEEAGGSPSGGGGGTEFQSGTLTAGSFDDNLNYDDYTRFVTEALAADTEGVLPEITPQGRVIIQVRDEAGTGIGGARVVVAPADEATEGAALIDLPTGTDGRVLFLSGLDGGEQTSNFSVTVYPPDGGEPATQSGSVADGQWEIVLPETAASLPTQLDLLFVVDTTGSMGDELEFLKVEVGDIAASVRGEFPDVDQRYALIVYRDDGDVYVTRTFDFTDRLDEFQDTLAVQFAAGGGDIPEAMHLAVEEAAGLGWRDAGTARVLFLLTDAPPHPEFAERTLNGLDELRSAGVAIYPIAASGADTEAEYILRAAAVLTLSQYLFLTDDSGFGFGHSEPDIPCYVVERLDRLMIRMITSELRGLPEYPDPQDGIRSVGNPQSGVCLPDE